jgi:methyl-accepting chemotaxis protein
MHTIPYKPQVRSIAVVIKAVAHGDLTKFVEVDASGEMLDLKLTINETVQRLQIFTTELTYIAREAGTEGKLGSRAEVLGFQGSWKDLSDGVNVSCVLIS